MGRPGTGARNTVHRGPKRDLVAAIADAVRAEGLRFGVYYSGGLDWSTATSGRTPRSTRSSELRPRDAAYNLYAFAHVADLVRRYEPSVLWNDIEWPDAGKRGGPESLHALFEDYYAAVPDGVVNDRWGDTHHDFATSEYEYAPGLGGLGRLGEHPRASGSPSATTRPRTRASRWTDGGSPGT